MTTLRPLTNLNISPVDLVLSAESIGLVWDAQMGFTTVGYSVLAENADQDALEKAIAVYRPEEYAFPVDGLIFEYDDLAYPQSGG